MTSPSVLRHSIIIAATTCLAALFLSGADAWAQDEPLGVVLSRLAADPSIEEAQRAALRNATLEPRRARRLLSRVRCAGVLPRVEASLSRGLSRDEDLDRAYQEMDELSLATDEDLDFRLTVRWDLDRLIYDPEELRAYREVASQAQRRRELLLAVTRMYYELLLLRFQQETQPAADSASRVERELRIDELRALLDGLTGGLFTRGQGGEGPR